MLIAILMAALPAASLAAAEPREHYVQLFERGEYGETVAALLAEKRRDAKAFASRGLSYLLGRAAEADGQLALALNSYREAVKHSIYEQYALARLSRFARRSGNLQMEALSLRRLARHTGALEGAAVERLAENSLERGNFKETLHLLERIPTLTASSIAAAPADRRHKELAARAYLAAGDDGRARQIFTELLVSAGPRSDDQALASVRALDRMDGGSATDVPGLGPDEHMRRAAVYQFNRDFASARRHYEAVVASASPDAAEALLQIGRGSAQVREYAEALKWYERLLESFPDSPQATDALLQAAASYSRLSRPRIAIIRYESFIEKYPNDERLDRAYFNIVDVLRDQGSDQEALKWCAQIGERFRGRTPEAVAIFTAARIHLVREEWDLALSALDRLEAFPDLGGSSAPGGTSRAEVRFIRALVLEKLGRFGEAIDAYLSIPDGRGEYYGWRATERLRELAKNEEAAALVAQNAASLRSGLGHKEAEARRQSASGLLRLGHSDATVTSALAESIRSQPIANLPVFKAVDPAPKGSAAAKLLELGLFQEAAAELSLTPKPKTIDDQAVALARVLSKGNAAFFSLDLIEPIWRKVPPEYPIVLLPRPQMRLLYPVPFRDEVLASSDEYQVDPRLMLAIMRQESRFDPDARSGAAARGLMQFIHSTAVDTANRVELRGFSESDLYDPAVSIRLGAEHIASLFSTFPEQPHAVVASYNGGSDNVKRWITRSRSNTPDRYVPELMFSQTKEYVQKVLANYRMYTVLYDERLKPIDQ